MKGAVAEKRKEKVWTYEDYLNSTYEGRYELINGRLERMPAPTFLNQEVLTDLLVSLGERVVVQPGIVFISEENLKNVRKDRLFGPPDLVVEIVSPNTVRRDTFVKKELYAETTEEGDVLGSPQHISGRSMETVKIRTNVPGTVSSIITGGGTITHVFAENGKDPRSYGPDINLSEVIHETT